jgi:hypothetical protein
MSEHTQHVRLCCALVASLTAHLQWLAANRASQREGGEQTAEYGEEKLTHRRERDGRAARNRHTKGDTRDISLRKETVIESFR